MNSCNIYAGSGRNALAGHGAAQNSCHVEEGLAERQKAIMERTSKGQERYWYSNRHWNTRVPATHLGFQRIEWAATAVGVGWSIMFEECGKTNGQ